MNASDAYAKRDQFKDLRATLEEWLLDEGEAPMSMTASGTACSIYPG